MKPTTEVFKHRGTNAFGAACITNRRQYLVTREDVGREFGNYQGYAGKWRSDPNKAGNYYLIKPSDVGRTIEVIVDQGCVPSIPCFGQYNCWYFMSVKKRVDVA